MTMPTADMEPGAVPMPGVTAAPSRSPVLPPPAHVPPPPQPREIPDAQSAIRDPAGGSGLVPDRALRVRDAATVAAEGKHWSQSMTVWGALLTMLTVGLPVLGPLAGVPITPDAARILGDQLVQVLQAIGVVAGTGMQLCGRARAAGPLERREITLRL